MAIQTEKPKYEIAPEGAFLAVCVAVVDLGTQRVTFAGKSYDQHQVYFCFELSEEKDSRDEPFLIASSYSLVTTGKSKLKPLIAGLFGKESAESDSFDVTKFKGQTCIVTIAHYETGSGRTVAQINSISRPMKGQKASPPVHKPFIFEMGQGIDQPLFGLPEWLPYLFGEKVHEVVAKAKELKTVFAAAALEAEVGGDEDNNIPF